MLCFFLFLFLNTSLVFFFFFFNDTATTEIYTLSLHDALPISRPGAAGARARSLPSFVASPDARLHQFRSEEHTSELQSLAYLVCRLLLEKKKKLYSASSRSCSPATILTDQSECAST